LKARISALRIRHPAAALFFSSVASTTLGAGVYAFGVAIWRLDERTNQMPFTLGGVLLHAVIAGLLIVPISAAVAVPISWGARRMRIESMAFYIAFGAAAAFAISLGIIGWPRADEFAPARPLRVGAVLAGATWGLLWWQVHRRWKWMKAS
jgi:hypothetical protein